MSKRAKHAIVYNAIQTIVYNAMVSFCKILLYAALNGIFCQMYHTYVIRVLF